MKIILTLSLLISLPSFATDNLSGKNFSNESTIEIELDEDMEILGKGAIVIQLDKHIEMSGDGSGVFILDKNMQMPDGSTIEIELDEDMEMSGKAKERIMNKPNYLMNRKECKEVKAGVAGFLMMSDGIWEEIKKDPEDKDKWAEVMALSSLASNYSNVYDVWCKGLTRHGMKKMKIKAKNYQQNKKDQEN